MIKLYKFGANLGLPDASPFVLKLETYLRLSDIEHETKSADVRKAPKGKLPCLEVDGEIIADSQFAISFLKNRFGDKLNEGLDRETLGQHHLMRLGLENHSYFLFLGYRWLEDKNAEQMYKSYFSKMGMMGKVIFKLVQRDIRKTCQGHGILRHSPAEREQLAKDDIQALEAVLGDKAFFGGEHPCEIDCVTFAFLTNMLVPEFDHPYFFESRKSSKLIAYNNRMTELVFPDYKESMII